MHCLLKNIWSEMMTMYTKGYFHQCHKILSVLELYCAFLKMLYYWTYIIQNNIKLILKKENPCLNTVKYNVSCYLRRVIGAFE